MTREVTDEDLLGEVRIGNAAAFEVFYRRWMPAVMSYHRRATGSPELALDLTAETFAAVVASIDRFDRDRGAASVWLFAIARHKLHESFRRAQVEASAREELGWSPVAVDDDDLERVEEIASGGSGALESLIARLPEDQRVALLERVVEERDYRAIAADMACSEMVVRQRVHRALRSLRRMLEQAP
jgi:RNA polymerase sigma-70 factor (ECF subfamily)